MYSTLVFLFALLAASVNGHFQLQYPPPRGVFDEDNEPTFCDGYLTAATNRSQFPLSGGFFSLNSEHPQWTAGVLISTLPDPQSFNNFSQVNSFFQVQGEGAFCIPLDFSKSNVTSLSTGQNVTIQIVFDGGDDQLYQCADLTLSNSFTIPTSVSCTNATSTTAGSASTSTGAASTPRPSSLGVREHSIPTLTIPFMLIGAVLGLAAW